MAFWAAIPSILSALGSMGGQQGEKEAPVKPMSVVADRMPWQQDGFDTPNIRNPKAASYDEMLKLWNSGGSNGYR